MSVHGMGGSFDPLQQQLRQFGLDEAQFASRAAFAVDDVLLTVAANHPGPLRSLVAQLSAYQTAVGGADGGLSERRCDARLHVVDYAPDQGPSLPLGPGAGDEQWSGAPPADQVHRSGDLWHARWGALYCCWRPFDLLITSLCHGQSLRCDLIAADPFSRKPAATNPPRRPPRLRLKGDPAGAWDEMLDGLKGLALCGWGFCCMHAAAVAWGDKAILLVGPSGCGKTTTALALARAGFRLLTDEIAYFCAGADRAPEVRGLRQPPLLQGAVRPDLGDLEASLHRAVEQPKQAHRALVTGGAVATQCARLAAVLFLDTVREPAGHVVVPVLPTEAFSRLTAQVLDALAPLRREQHMTQIAHLLGQVPCHEIRLGPDLKSLAEIARHLLTP